MTHPFQVAIKEPWVLAAMVGYEVMQPKNAREFAEVSAQMWGKVIDAGASLTTISNLVFTLDCLWKFWRNGAQCFELTESLAFALAMTDPGDIEWELPYDGFWIGFGGAKFETLMQDFFEDNDNVVNLSGMNDLDRETIDAVEALYPEKRIRLYHNELHVGGQGYNAIGCYVSRSIDEDGEFEINVHAIDPSHHITSGTQVMVGKHPTSPLGRLLKNLCLYLSTPEAEIKQVHDRRAKTGEMLAKAISKAGNPSGLAALAPWIAKKTKPSVTRVGGTSELGETRDGGTADVIRSAHWVRGHWRQQWYGAADDKHQRPKWIRPHKRGGIPEQGIRTYEVQR